MVSFVVAGMLGLFLAEQAHHRCVTSTHPHTCHSHCHHTHVCRYLGQSEMLSFCAGRGIRVMAYSPLGSSADRSPPEHGTTLLRHPVVANIAEQVGRSPGQVLIRFSLERGAISIPKSSKPERIRQNGDVLGWSLSEAQMGELLALECDFRYFGEHEIGVMPPPLFARLICDRGVYCVSCQFHI